MQHDVINVKTPCFGGIKGKIKQDARQDIGRTDCAKTKIQRYINIVHSWHHDYRCRNGFFPIGCGISVNSHVIICRRPRPREVRRFKIDVETNRYKAIPDVRRKPIQIRDRRVIPIWRCSGDIPLQAGAALSNTWHETGIQNTSRSSTNPRAIVCHRFNPVQHDRAVRCRGRRRGHGPIGRWCRRVCWRCRSL
jgi:hypothetical protein